MSAVSLERPRPRKTAWTSTLTFIRREPFVLICLALLVVLVACAVAPSWIAAHNPTKGSLKEVRQAPSGRHPLGTDALGRDVLSRIIFGARISLQVSLLATLVGAAFGSLLGLIAGYFGGIVDAVAMRFVDVMLAFPGVLLAMAIIAARGRSISNLVLAIGIASIPGYARLLRGQVLSIRKRPFIEASISAG